LMSASIAGRKPPHFRFTASERLPACAAKNGRSMNHSIKRVSAWC